MSKKKEQQLKEATEWNSDYAEYPWTTAICPHCNEHLKYEMENGCRGDTLRCYECNQEFKLGETDYELGWPPEITAKQFILLFTEENRITMLNMLKTASQNLQGCNGIIEAETTYNLAIELIKKQLNFYRGKYETYKNNTRQYL